MSKKAKSSYPFMGSLGGKWIFTAGTLLMGTSYLAYSKQKMEDSRIMAITGGIILAVWSWINIEFAVSSADRKQSLEALLAFAYYFVFDQAELDRRLR